jgi:beta-N-acetylhexosaminidase
MASGGPTYTRSKGKLAGAALKALGVDVDLAPVGDVPSSTSSFMWLAQRTFGFTTASVNANANAFALGLRDGGELATMKHFPGIGRANQNTDNFVVSIPAGLGALESADLVPYGPAIANGIPLIMLSNADYPELDPLHGAGWSYAIVKNLLRTQLGFRGVTITDSLTAAAHTRGLGPSTLAIQAAAAGTDFILVDSLESATSTVYSKLLAAAKAGTIPLARLQASYQRIVALKAGQ